MMSASVARIAVGVKKSHLAPAVLSNLHDPVVQSSSSSQISSSTAIFNGSPNKLNVSEGKMGSNDNLSASDQLSSSHAGKRSAALSSHLSAAPYSSNLTCADDEATDIALNQLKELDIAIEVRKVTKVDGRKTRWIEYRKKKQALKQAVKAAKECQRILKRRKQRNNVNSKYKLNIKGKLKNASTNKKLKDSIKTVINRDDHAVVNDIKLVDDNFNSINNNNNNIDLNKMKVESPIPSNPNGTNVVLETMKQQFLQGTLGSPELVTNVREKHKRRSKIGNGNIATSVDISTNELAKRKPGRPKRLENPKTPIKISEQNSPKTELSPVLPPPFTPLAPSVNADSSNCEKKPDVNILNQVASEYYSRRNYLTKGLREIRKSDSGSESNESSPLKDNSMKVLVPSSPPLPVSPVPPLCNSLSPKCPSSDNLPQVFSPNTKNSKVSARLLEARKKKIANTMSKKENIDLSIQSNGIQTHLQNGSLPANQSGCQQLAVRNKKRGRKCKTRDTDDLGTWSKKTSTVIVDVHNTMSGEPQTVIPAHNPIMHHKRKLSPKSVKSMLSSSNSLPESEKRKESLPLNSLSTGCSKEKNIESCKSSLNSCDAHQTEITSCTNNSTGLNDKVIEKSNSIKNIQNSDLNMAVENPIKEGRKNSVNKTLTFESTIGEETLSQNNPKSQSLGNIAKSKDVILVSESNGKRQTSIKDFMCSTMSSTNSTCEANNEFEVQVKKEKDVQDSLGSDSTVSTSRNSLSKTVGVECVTSNLSANETFSKTANSLNGTYRSVEEPQSIVNSKISDTPLQPNQSSILESASNLINHGNNGEMNSLSKNSKDDMEISSSEEISLALSLSDDLKKLEEKKNLKHNLPDISNNLIGKQKDKVPRILKQLFRDEGVQNMLRSIKEDSSPTSDGSVNHESLHKLRPKRANEYTTSESPEPDEIQVQQISKRKKRGTEADNLFLDEGTLNLLTSIESPSRRLSTSDDNVNSSNIEGTNSTVQVLDSKVQKQKVNNISPITVPDSTTSQQDIENCHSNNSTDHSSLLANKKITNNIEKPKTKPGRPSFSVPLKHKSKAQIVLQLRKDLRNLGLPYEDKSIAEMKEMLNQNSSITMKSVPPLKIKVPANYNNPVKSDKVIPANGKIIPVSSQSSHPSAKDNSQEVPMNSTKLLLTEARKSLPHTLNVTSSQKEIEANGEPLKQHQSTKRYSSPVGALTSLFRPSENGVARGRVKGVCEAPRQSQRSSARQNESFSYRDICVRKFNNFLQIILAPSTTKMKNALNSRVLRELCDALNSVRRDDSVRVVLVTATGSTFCQGIDLTALQHPNPETRKRNADNLIRGLRDFVRVLSHFPKVVVAGVNGNAMGLGVTMLPLFDAVYASEKAEFFLPYAKLGQVPEGGATFTFPNYYGKLQSNKVFLGQKLTASQAMQMGLVSECIWPATFQEVLIPKVAQMATLSAQSMEGTKALVNHHILTKVELSVESECRLLSQQWTSVTFTNLCKRFLDVNDVPMQKPVSLPS